MARSPLQALAPAMQRCKLVLIFLALLLAGDAPGAAAQVQGGPPRAHPRKEDIPFIRCEVCQLLAKNAWKQTRELLKTSTPSKRVDELAVIELMEKIAAARKPEGQWIARLDLVESGDRLLVKEMEEVGECGVECKTIERCAEELVGEHDTDMAELLFTGKKNRAQFTNWLCYELTGACKPNPPPLPKNRQPGPVFKPRPAESQDLDEVLGNMEDQGLRGQVFSREELMKQYGMMGGDAEDAEEEEEDEAPNPVQHQNQQGPGLVEQANKAFGSAAAAAKEGVQHVAGAARSLLHSWVSKLQEGSNAGSGAGRAGAADEEL